MATEADREHRALARFYIAVRKILTLVALTLGVSFLVLLGAYAFDLPAGVVETLRFVLLLAGVVAGSVASLWVPEAIEGWRDWRNCKNAAEIPYWLFNAYEEKLDTSKIQAGNVDTSNIQAGRSFSKDSVDTHYNGKEKL